MSNDTISCVTENDHWIYVNRENDLHLSTYHKANRKLLETYILSSETILKAKHMLAEFDIIDSKYSIVGFCLQRIIFFNSSSTVRYSSFIF
jgi:hypothetical protein